jgi:hypothetical protein
MLKAVLFMFTIFGSITAFQPASASSSKNLPEWACAPNPGSKILYVDARATGDNDGSSWRNAFSSLAVALSVAANRAPAQIWVAQGNYANGGTPYILAGATQIYGGFAGHERSLLARDLTHNTTVLSAGASTTRVLYTQNTNNVSLDGVTITGGHALGNLDIDAFDSTNEVRGGALLALDAEVAICRTTFRDNRAKKFGGAIFQRGGQLRVQNSVFVQNSVLRGEMEVHDEDSEADTDGGAISVHNASQLQVYASRFERNVAGDDGAAIATRKTNVEIVSSHFVRNKGIAGLRSIDPTTAASGLDFIITSQGGAVQIWNEYFGVNDQSQSTLLKDSEFIENQSQTASAAYIQSPPGSVTTIVNCKFMRNGGKGVSDSNAPLNERAAAFGRDGGTIMLIGLRFRDREQDANGNFLRPLHKGIVRDSLFQDNEGGQGGAYVQSGLDGEIINSVFVRNTGRQRGGAIWSHNFLALLDQLFGFNPVFSSLRVDKSVFIGNRTLGLLERLQVETFPGLVGFEEMTYGGGAIHNEIGNILNVTDSEFVDNSSTNSDGGAIHNANTSVMFFGSMIPPAPTTYAGKLIVNNSRFHDNKVIGSGSGGAIANGGSQANGAVFDAEGRDVRDQQVPASATIKNSVFWNNSAEGFGGALTNWSGATLNLSESNIHGNVAANGGGVASVALPANTASMSLIEVNIKHNLATVGQGGGVFARGTTADIQDSNITNNSPNDVD